jgi:hypothetical protein
LTAKVSSPGTADISPSHSTVDGTARRHLLHRQCAAGDEAAAADRHEQSIRHQSRGTGVRGQFQAAGALAGDDARIVIGRDQRRSGALGFRPRQSLAVVVDAVERHDGGTPSPGRPRLDGRRIGRHEDRRGQAGRRRRIGRRLRVVAGGEGDDAAGVAVLDQRQHGIHRSAQLETTGVLQRLGLQQHLAADGPVQHGALQQRRLAHAVATAGAGGEAVLKGRQADLHGDAPDGRRVMRPAAAGPTVTA